jgi:hypothetical protein
VDHPDDWKFWKIAVEENPDIFRTEKSFKYELSQFRDEWREHGVIVETGCGEQRKRVLVSRSRYIDFYRQRTRQRAA